jgi:hypothetical protein
MNLKSEVGLKIGVYINSFYPTWKSLAEKVSIEPNIAIAYQVGEVIFKQIYSVLGGSFMFNCIHLCFFNLPPYISSSPPKVRLLVASN